MVKNFSKNVTLGKLLRFPFIMGCVVIGAGFGVINFKHIYRKEIEEGRENHMKFADEMFQRSKNNRIKEEANGKEKD